MQVPIDSQNDLIVFYLTQAKLDGSNNKQDEQKVKKQELKMWIYSNEIAEMEIFLFYRVVFG